MPDFLDSSVGQIQSAVRLADVIDIIVVSIFAYAVIVWIQRARSRFVILGFAALVLVYWFARLLEMHLTLFLFQAGITVALVALVVIFQEDIRRAFERIAVSRLVPGRRQAPSGMSIVDTVVEAVASFANTRTGALIVFKGKEPLERHVTGGNSLYGQLTEALLHSIFDRHSSGHDGAVLIENGLVTRFGVHLPLSTSVTTKYGTRHTAALGLSERSDALIVVVSEERGSISVARAGKLEVVPSAAELRTQLLHLVTSQGPKQRQPFLARLFARNVREKLLAVAIAISAWLVDLGYQSETVTRTFPAPLVFRDVPEGWSLDQPEPLDVRITLTGPSRPFEKVEDGGLLVTLDLAKLKPGRNRMVLTNDHLEYPDALTLQSIEPRAVHVTAYRTTVAQLPVEPAMIGKLANSLVLKDVQTTPSKVSLELRTPDIGRIKQVATVPIELNKLDKSTTLDRSLRLPAGAQLVEGQPDKVSVTVSIASSQPKRTPQRTDKPPRQ